jgi:hypothetical protein
MWWWAARPQNRTVPGTDRVIGFFVNGRFTRSQPDR